MDCAEIWFVVRDPLAWHFTTFNGGVRVHVRSAHVRTPFSYLGIGWTDCAETWYVVRGSIYAFTQNGDIRKNARVTVHTFKQICSLPLVHRPKSVLLVHKCQKTLFCMQIKVFQPQQSETNAKS